MTISAVFLPTLPLLGSTAIPEDFPQVGGLPKLGRRGRRKEEEEKRKGQAIDLFGNIPKGRNWERAEERGGEEGASILFLYYTV